MKFIKKLTITLILTSSFYGITIGNPADPALIESGLIFEEAPYIGFRSTYLSNYVTKAKYRNQMGVEINTTYTNYIGKAILNILRRADLYAFVGASRGNSVLVNNTQKIDIQQKQMICVGGGAKLIAFEYNECYFLGFDTKYYRYYPSIDHLIINETPLNIDQLRLKTWQWEFSSAFARKFGIFVPYTGVSYLVSRQKPDSNNPFLSDAKQINPWGLFIGSSITYRDSYSINLEAKFFNQIEYSISADIQF